MPKGIMLQLNHSESAADSWARQVEEAQGMKLQGFDAKFMAIRPYKIPTSWGEDLGPHISFVPDFEWQKVDETIRKYIKKEWDNREYDIGPITYSDLFFLNGSPQNDDETNGPIIIARHLSECVKEKLRELRKTIGHPYNHGVIYRIFPSDFPKSYNPHVSLAKITGHDNNHADFRKQHMTKWKAPVCFPPPLMDLSEM